MIGERRRLQELGRAEAMRLLASVTVGRIVFTHRALPAIRPVNHLVEDGAVVIRTHAGAAVLAAACDGVVVAYEADAIDPVDHVGWSVVVTGMARMVEDPGELRRYAERLHPWISMDMNQIVRIDADLVTGFRVVAGPLDEGDGGAA